MLLVEQAGRQHTASCCSIIPYITQTDLGNHWQCQIKWFFAENVPALYSLLRNNMTIDSTVKYCQMVSIYHSPLQRTRRSQKKKRETVHQHPLALFLAWCWISTTQQVGYPFILFGQQMKKHPFRQIQFGQIWHIHNDQRCVTSHRALEWFMKS